MTSEDGPSRKRARVDEEEGPPELQKDEQVWLSDGNIVVIASNKIAFRVHKSILSLRSEVFSDLFSLPDADAATPETMDGYPVVHVSDSPDDIHRLFLVLCCGKKYVTPSPIQCPAFLIHVIRIYYHNRDVIVAVPFEVLSSLIRMAHKYAIQDVLDDALSRLKKYYTSSLALWQDPGSRARWVATTDDDAPAVIELAQLTNTPLLLPPALLICVKLATRPGVADDGSAKSRVSSLSVQDQARLVHAKGYLTQACATRALHLVAAVPSAACTSRRTCTAAREAALHACRDQGSWYCLRVPCLSDDNALKPIAEKLWKTEDWERFCGSCQDALVKMDEKGMKGLWFALPDVFNVDIDKNVWRWRSGGGPSQ